MMGRGPDVSGLAFGNTERRGRAAALRSGGTRQIDGAEGLFIFCDVVLQSQEQALGVFGSEHNARFYIGFGYTRQYADEVHDHLGAGMGDDGQVGVDAFGHLGRQFDLQLVGIVGLVCVVHKFRNVV